MKEIEAVEHLLLHPKYNGRIRLDKKRELATEAYKAGLRARRRRK